MQGAVRADRGTAHGARPPLREVAGKQTFFFGKGCDNCNNTGYRGRQGIYEIMLLDDEMRDMIVKHASTQVHRAVARTRARRTRRQSGL